MISNSVCNDNKEESESIYNFRSDGRYQTEIRKFRFSIRQDNGPEIFCFSQGLSSVEVHVNSRESKESHEVIIEVDQDGRFEKVSERKMWEIKMKLERIYKRLILKPKYYSIYVRVIEDSGSILSVIINAITLCFCYSGIPVRDFVVSLTFNECYDLTISEENREPFVILALGINSNESLYFESQGKSSRDFIKRIITDKPAMLYELSRQIKNFIK